MEAQLAAGLDVEDDDVLTDTPPSQPQPLGPCQGQSQPSARVFVEKSSEWERQGAVLLANANAVLANANAVLAAQSASSPRTARPGGRPASRWTTWPTSSRPSGPAGTFLSGCTEASGGPALTGPPKAEASAPR